MEHLIAFVLGIFIGIIVCKLFDKKKVSDGTIVQPTGNNPATEETTPEKPVQPHKVR